MFDIKSVVVIRDAEGKLSPRCKEGPYGPESVIIPFRWKFSYDGSVKGLWCNKAYIDGIDMGSFMAPACQEMTETDVGEYASGAFTSFVRPCADPWPYNFMGHTLTLELSRNDIVVSKTTGFRFEDESQHLILGGAASIVILLGVAYLSSR